MNPNSKLWLCKTKLERDYRNTLTFSTKNAQRNYFIGDPSNPSDYGVSTKRYNDFTYLRIENAIKVDEFIENIDTNNYAVILNDTKYYYYFITSMDYIDETTTKIHIELDVMQTYFFDIVYNNTFVEREHVADDTAGLHTLPEGLETGDYIGSDAITIEGGTDYIIFQVINETSPNPNDPWESVPTQYGGVYSGTEFMIFDLTNAGRYIKYMDEKGKKDYIINIFMYHGTITEGTTYNIIDQGSIVCEYTEVQTSSSATFQTNLSILQSKPTKVGYYTPRNKKLLTYPYCYLLANNNGGTSKLYKYEDFDSNDITFAKISCVSAGGSVMYYPQSYKMGRDWSSVINYNEGFVGAKFPTCSWTSDGYINWLTQTSVNRENVYKEDALKTSIGALTLLGGIATGNAPLAFTGATGLSSGITQGIGDTLNNMQSKEEHQIAPLEIAGNASAGDVIYSHFRCKPIFVEMSIKEEYAKIIDKFFDQYGYQVNILKTPSIHTRSKWNYLKTSGCNFTGNIPQEYITKIKNIFDTGITFWHDPSHMLDYSQTNSILS